MVLAIFMWVSKYGLHVAGSNNVVDLPIGKMPLSLTWEERN